MADRTTDKRQTQMTFHDEFDKPQTGPVGLHRGKRSAAARTMPYIIVLVVAVFCALLAWGFLSGNIQALVGGGTAKPVVTATQVKDAVKKRTSASTTSKKKASSKSAKKSSSSTSSSSSDSSGSTSTDSQSSSQSPSQAAQADHSTQVVVFNALPATVAARNGYAARQAAVLTNAGYTSVSANTLTSGLPQTNVVWYRSSSDEATARDVASKLGISAVQQQTSLREAVAAIFVSAQ